MRVNLKMVADPELEKQVAEELNIELEHAKARFNELVNGDDEETSEDST